MENTQEDPWDVLRLLIADNDQARLETYVHELTPSPGQNTHVLARTYRGYVAIQ